MVMLLRLPDEILVQILSYVPAKQLSDVFLLQSDSTANSYYQNLALYAKYFNTRTTIDGHRNGSLSFAELDRLVRNRVSIKPREISLVLTGTMNHQGELQLWMQDLPMACVIARYHHYLSRLQTNFNIKLVIIRHAELLVVPFSVCQHATFKALMATLNNSVKSLSIEYSSLGKRLAPRQVMVLDNPDAEIDPACSLLHLTNLARLKLHFFSSSALMSHLRLNSCLFGVNLHTLDLSYNCINDSQAAQIQFPPLLRSLNLSNNELTNLCFEIDDNLENLNLSNNSLVRLTTTRNKIRHLNVSCNLLKREAINDLEAFTQLESLDLSRNMISNLFNVKFPKMKKLSLSGNHIDYLTHNCIPELVQEIDLSYCRISEEHECFKRRKMRVIMQ